MSHQLEAYIKQEVNCALFVYNIQRWSTLIDIEIGTQKANNSSRRMWKVHEFSIK